MDNQEGETSDVKNESPLHHDIQMQRKQRRNTEDYLKVIKVFGGVDLFSFKATCYVDGSPTKLQFFTKFGQNTFFPSPWII